MKKLQYISVLLLMFAASCDVLDVQPYHSIPAELAITDANQLEGAIIGCYDAFQSGGYYGLNYLVFGDLPSDNLSHVGITVTWSDFDNNTILADNGLVESTWASIYNALGRVNNVIDQIPLISENTLSEEEKTQALAELHFLRALAHYDLMRLFGPIPLRDKAVTSDEESLNPGRNSINDVLLLINSDLDYAIEHLPSSIIKARASQAAAQALKARVLLHQYNITQSNALLEQAIDNATAVIDHPSLQLVAEYADLFSGEPNTESVFELVYSDQDRNLIARYFAHTSLNGRYEFAPTPNYLNAFETEDVRDTIIKYAGSAPYVTKFNDVAAGTDPVYVLRLAEMYLIRAEAASLLERPTSGIMDDINVIRERAGLTAVSISSYTGLLLEVEAQRRKEFAFEGHRWFDLVRTGRALAVLDNVTHVNQTLFPIPQAEIIANNNPEMYQNEGY
jgi:starch-binding outer membrane protein, SusD/RagB family